VAKLSWFWEFDGRVVGVWPTLLWRKRFVGVFRLMRVLGIGFGC